MQKRRLPIGKIMLAVLLLAGIAVAYRQSLVPPMWSPLPALDLANPRGWTGGLLLDWQLAELRRSPELCARVLKKPHIVHTRVPDQPYDNRCGWVNAVSVSAAA